MLFFSFFLVVFNTLVVVCPETALEIEVADHLISLEDQTYFPISIYLSSLTSQLENLITNFSHYEIEAKELIHSYTEGVKEDIEVTAETFDDIGIDIDKCEENIYENYKQLVKTSSDDAKFVVLEGITRAQTILSEAKNVFMVTQNSTVAVKLKVQHCLSLLDDTECLFEALNAILIMERTLPQIISSVGEHHETQLKLLEDNVVGNLEKIVVKVFDAYVELMDEFLICVLQWS